MKLSERWYFYTRGISNFIPSTPLNKTKQLIKTVNSNKLLDKYHVHRLIKAQSKDLARKQGRIHSYDCVRQALALNSIKDFISQTKCVCVIGDGYGYMGTLLKMMYPDMIVVSVNLNKILFFDVFYTRKVLSNTTLTLMQDKEDFGHSKMVFLRAEDYHLLQGLPIDFFINIASFQEMNPSITKQYFYYMNSSSKEKVYLYSCNRIEKTLPDGTITKFQDIPWNCTETLFNELPGWYQNYPISKPPFWKPLDGPVIHRLAILT